MSGHSESSLFLLPSPLEALAFSLSAPNTNIILLNFYLFLFFFRNSNEVIVF